MVYHVLPELEQFCPNRGGALAKIVAQHMRFDESRVVSCYAADRPWGHERDRILVIPELLPYGKLRGRRFLPTWVKGRFFRRVFRPLLSRLEPGDIIWIHHQPYIAAALEKAIHVAGARLIYQAHDGRVRRTERTAFRSFVADAWVFDSGALRQTYLALFPEWRNAHVLYNGADVKLFYPADSGAVRNNAIPVILYVGRIQAEKGVHVLLDAVRILQQRGVEVSCKLIGSHFSGVSKVTPYMRSLQKSKPPNAEFTGYLAPERVVQELRSADIFCCPSIWLEAFGMVTVEAMACGVPVVASQIGGLPEVGSEGGMAFVEPGSAVGLADALQRLIQDKNLRQKMSDEGVASVQRRFTWDAIARQYLHILEGQL
jgi:glycosyltransferase involved in cell wall biosynthesis